MAQKRKPNITKKQSPAETPKVENTAPAKTVVPKAPAKQKQAEVKIQGFIFDKRNYLLMLAGIVFIIIGVIVMAGGGSKDPKVFNPAIFDTQRLTIAPLLILAGYVIEVFAIMLKPKQKAEA
jgi:hypothetical protein